MAEEGEKNCRGGASDRLKVGGGDDVDGDAPKHAIGDGEVVRGHADEVGLVGGDEATCEPSWEGFDALDEAGENAHNGGSPEACFCGVEDAAEIACAPVVAEDGLQALLGALNRRKDQNQNALEDAQGGDVGGRFRFVGGPLGERDRQGNTNQ